MPSPAAALALSFRRRYVRVVVLALAIFGATYFTYLARHHMHESGSYLPLAMGAAAFFGCMAWLNFRSFAVQAPPSRVAKAVGFALVETMIFVCAFFLLLLNTIGS